MKRKFTPGSEWIYLKIYTGVKTADIILEEAVLPLIDYLKQTHGISCWFFIRYNDPKSHLRIRIKCNTQNHSEIFAKINKDFYEYVESGEISNILFDSYHREIERYGVNTYHNAEVLFHQNSEFVVECLDYDDEEKIIISLFYIDEILNKLNLPIQEKLEWIKGFNFSFKEEFNADKKLNSQLDKKYRELKPKFLEFLNSEEFSEERNEVIANIEESSAEFQNIYSCHENQSLGMPLQNFFQSIFHMNINRLFVSNQRVFEMVIYDYLFRYYKSSVYSLRK
ncbi:lantibiotic dehydratase [Chryseobacterium sp. T16E-39]|uniref:thiopeptide-type bacteriocin biosynthesis protein n=1 Tax=Chryseobacterium sp. T16E-39 TaxID=2015076 RepID=UPI000B5B1B91|nr:thiopeptide-type bacteriocin biosynthesis protein [Chryseobacterium sp. T16E-39]ASK31924.1 lantibiotic dehydratase [Chryseobacterium sp. T16E-39]